MRERRRRWPQNRGSSIDGRVADLRACLLVTVAENTSWFDMVVYWLATAGTCLRLAAI